MFSPEGVEQNVISSHLEPRLFFLLLLALRNQVLDQQRRLGLHSGGAVDSDLMLDCKLLLQVVLLTVVPAHSWASRSSCGTPVRKIAKLNVGVENAHAGVYRRQGQIALTMDLQCSSNLFSHRL